MYGPGTTQRTNQHHAAELLRHLQPLPLPLPTAAQGQRRQPPGGAQACSQAGVPRASWPQVAHITG